MVGQAEEIPVVLEVVIRKEPAPVVGSGQVDLDIERVMELERDELPEIVGAQPRRRAEDSPAGTLIPPAIVIWRKLPGWYRRSRGRAGTSSRSPVDRIPAHVLRRIGIHKHRHDLRQERLRFDAVDIERAGRDASVVTVVVGASRPSPRSSAPLCGSAAG
jgi:hypothetical protein